MTTPELTMPRYVGLKNHATINEKVVARSLAREPGVAAWPTSSYATATWTPPAKWRTTCMLEDVEQRTRYEVEIG